MALYEIPDYMFETREECSNLDIGACVMHQYFQMQVHGNSSHAEALSWTSEEEDVPVLNDGIISIHEDIPMGQNNYCYDLSSFVSR